MLVQILLPKLILRGNLTSNVTYIKKKVRTIFKFLPTVEEQKINDANQLS